MNDLLGSPSNTFPTRNVTLSLGVKAFAVFFFAATLGAEATTTSGVTVFSVGVAIEGEVAALPKSARRISASVNSGLIDDLRIKGGMLILPVWPRLALDDFKTEFELSSMAEKCSV